MTEIETVNNYYYNLQDILILLSGNISNWYSIIVKQVNRIFGTSFDSDDSEFSKALGGYLMNPNACLLVSEENLIDPNDEMNYKLMNIVAKYDSIIKEYKWYYEGLNTELTTIKQTNITKFNDTPTEEGDFSAKNYTSTISQSETETEYSFNDKLTLLAKKMNNLKQRFIKEFEEYVIWIK